VVVVVGPSGSGKSTLVRCVDQLERIDAGSVELDGELLGFRVDSRGVLRRLPDGRIRDQRRRMGMVFQSFNLFAHLTVGSCRHLDGGRPSSTPVLHRALLPAAAPAG